MTLAVGVGHSREIYAIVMVSMRNRLTKSCYGVIKATLMFFFLTKVHSIQVPKINQGKQILKDFVA